MKRKLNTHHIKEKIQMINLSSKEINLGKKREFFSFKPNQI